MRVVVTGGGTGGHIYPALALIRYIKQTVPEAVFLYIGTEKGLESTIVPESGIDFESVHITGIQRKLSLENVKTVYRFYAAAKKAKKILNEFQPEIVIGTGGYVCGPVVYAASRQKIPTMIHEQNSVPGLTNKFLAKFVDQIAVCFSEAEAYFPEEKTSFTGNPRATEAAETVPADPPVVPSLGLDPSKPVFLAVGGSRGARPINEAVLQAAESWKEENFQVIYVTGSVHYESISKEAASRSLPENVVIVPYVENMPELLLEVDGILTRAGATTLAEITAIGVPALLIPSPYVTADHQTKNAMSLVDRGAAEMIQEKELTPALLTEKLLHMLEPSVNKSMREASRASGRPDASKALFTLMQKMISN
ncbi:undecaprenyldiphospho-muramoylpentapeptide beta-N-acetylglucosaminyltransferase [Alkalicoccus urumqiensis]|uniref:UDP-N-acetylglucosamine--N-acetylmuramyl-(pentapeptide) pyrophosphoryl-undecaprenol N-acetylglucosamine transferase n=1 Tax=Alkalicoccus urumqiensis TaxID=1548213 RepID=A0A2P6MGA8_ALKUR|nr:undecaprenyldiphospho-muramoylpentapeptide beta-N-acetylglucosaminyltransferase [Alkalicoccus urumqiensis]PRO65314.1 undecaprenyldiphospho-muramoylpentapeptide beta-N-acetylglucosaminyltransferase [Alkalicoccus urumqiensis]